MTLQRPVILAVDDDPSGLASMLDALARRYGVDYRVTSQLSASAAPAKAQSSSSMSTNISPHLVRPPESRRE